MNTETLARFLPNIIIKQEDKMEHIEEWNLTIAEQSDVVARLFLLSVYGNPKVSSRIEVEFEEIKGIGNQLIAQYFFPDEAM